MGNSTGFGFQDDGYKLFSNFHHKKIIILLPNRLEKCRSNITMPPLTYLSVKMPVSNAESTHLLQQYFVVFFYREEYIMLILLPK